MAKIAVTLESVKDRFTRARKAACTVALEVLAERKGWPDWIPGLPDRQRSAAGCRGSRVWRERRRVG